jgi:vacuolar-type H+-ATPase subunit C/Vma6
MRTSTFKAYDYAFAIGKIRVLERYLLKKDMLLQMTALSPEQITHLLRERGLWHESILKVKDVSGLQEFFSQENLRYRRLLKSLLLDENLLSAILSIDDLAKSLDFALKADNEFFILYLKTCIDLANIKMYLRLKFLGKQATFKERYIPSGNIKISPHKELLDIESIFSPYRDLIKESKEYLEKNHSFLRLERLIDSYLIGILKRAKYLCLGAEPLISYFLAKELEMKMVHFILLARLKDLPSEILRERIPETYV